MENITLAITATLALATVVASTIAHINIYRGTRYTCKNCGKIFRPRTFLASAFAQNGDKQRRVRCSHCGKIDWAELHKS